MKSLTIRSLGLIGCVAAGLGLGVGCGTDGPGNDAPVRLIPSGGAGDGAIDGLLNVHVVDGTTDAPISGATVLIGEAGEEPLQGMTDSQGLLTLEDASLDGPTTVTIVASGYVVSTWFGANAANLTIPIDLQTQSDVVKQATLTGTIDGWDAMPAPPMNHFIGAILSYSQSDDLGDKANNIEQPAGDPGPNVCVKITPTTDCNWSLITRTGKVAVFATIIDFDTKGTEDSSDDVFTPIGYAYRLGLRVEDGVNMSAINLKMIDKADLSDVTLTLPSAPAGLDQVGSLIGVDAGDDGILMLGFGQEGTTLDAVVPTLTGVFADMTYRALAFAGDSQDPEDSDETKMSASIKRDITAAGDITMEAWLPMAGSIAKTGDTYSFTPVTGSTFHASKLIDTDDKTVWNIALLDGRTSFTLPAVTPSPLPSGTVDMTVDAFDGAVDLQDFEIDSFITSFKRLSKGRASL